VTSYDRSLGSRAYDPGPGIPCSTGDVTMASTPDTNTAVAKETVSDTTGVQDGPVGLPSWISETTSGQVASALRDCMKAREGQKDGTE
jgi:hypothetical protein